MYIIEIALTFYSKEEKPGCSISSFVLLNIRVVLPASLNKNERGSIFMSKRKLGKLDKGYLLAGFLLLGTCLAGLLMALLGLLVDLSARMLVINILGACALVFLVASIPVYFITRVIDIRREAKEMRRQMHLLRQHYEQTIDRMRDPTL